MGEPAIITHAASEPESVRVWALGHAVAMVLADDPQMDPIFDKLTGPERMRLGRCVTNAALPALEALQRAALTKGGQP